jgi:hypothetical protein
MIHGSNPRRWYSPQVTPLLTANIQGTCLPTQHSTSGNTYPALLNLQEYAKQQEIAHCHISTSSTFRDQTSKGDLLEHTYSWPFPCQLSTHRCLLFQVRSRFQTEVSLCLIPKNICSSTSSCILVEQHVLTSHRTSVPPPWNKPSLKVFKVFIHPTQVSKRISD